MYITKKADNSRNSIPQGKVHQLAIQDQRESHPLLAIIFIDNFI